MLKHHAKTVNFNKAIWFDDTNLNVLLNSSSSCVVAIFWPSICILDDTLNHKIFLL